MDRFIDLPVNEQRNRRQSWRWFLIQIWYLLLSPFHHTYTPKFICPKIAAIVTYILPASEKTRVFYDYLAYTHSFPLPYCPIVDYHYAYARPGHVHRTPFFTQTPWPNRSLPSKWIKVLIIWFSFNHSGVGPEGMQDSKSVFCVSKMPGSPGDK